MGRERIDKAMPHIGKTPHDSRHEYVMVRT